VCSPSCSQAPKPRTAHVCTLLSPSVSLGRTVACAMQPAHASRASAQAHADRHVQLQSVGLQSRPTGDNVAAHLARAVPAVEKERVVAAANRHHLPVPTHLRANTLAAAAAGISGLAPLLAWNDIVPNEVHWPVRIGRDLSPLFDGLADSRRVVTFAEIEFNRNLAAIGLSLNIRTPREFINLLAAMPDAAAPGAVAGDTHAGSCGVLDAQHSAQRGVGGWRPLHELMVAKVAAGSNCSAALTPDGRVWMFGYAHDRQFANGNAIQTEGRPVDGRPAQLIAAGGGAVDVAVGARFCAALTRTGAVVLWGSSAPDGLLCNPGPGRGALGSIGEDTARQRGLERHRITASVSALPAMAHIATGRSQLIMSDGEGVWQMRVLHDSVEKTASTLRRMKFDVRSCCMRSPAQCRFVRLARMQSHVHAPCAMHTPRRTCIWRLTMCSCAGFVHWRALHCGRR
jgi:hypothetical protein